MSTTTIRPGPQIERIPSFLVSVEPRYRLWGSALRALILPDSRAVHPKTQKSLFHLPDFSPRPGAGSLASSVLFHAAALTLIAYLPQWISAADRPDAWRTDKTVYEVQKIDLSAYLPALRAPGPGGKPGTGNKPKSPPALGATAKSRGALLISNPRVPDNTRQTIIQPDSPPELVIPFELRLPNIVIGSMAPGPRPPSVSYKIAAPAPKRLKAPVPSAPNIRTAPTDLTLASAEVANLAPKLPVPAPPPAPAKQAGEEASSNGAAVPGGAEGSKGASGGLLALSVDPAASVDVLALPPGNRYGAFSIALSGGQPGSPGGVPGGVPGGGTGGPGMGGDGSVGMGPGTSGGGGGNGAANSTFITSNGNDGNGAGGTLAESTAASPALSTPQIFPVVIPIRRPGNTLVITSGPVGGGGLRVYGVMRGGKVYTKYLPMPGKDWVLQYCQKAESSGNPSESRNVVTAFGRGLTAPWADEKYDFRRPAIPKDKRHEMIILHGMIREDGTIEGLRILQGVTPEADQAALAAFRRWKFNPAMQGTKQVSVEILVGIPAYLPASAPAR